MARNLFFNYTRWTFYKSCSSINGELDYTDLNYCLLRVMLSSNEVFVNRSELSVSNIRELLENNSLEQLYLFLEDAFFEDEFKKEPNVISHVSEFISSKIYSTRKEIFIFCEKLIYKLAELLNPDEAIFDFIEQAEDRDELKFCVMLKALQITLLKMPLSKRYYSLNWCHQTILQFIEDMPAVEDFKLEGDEVVLQETCEASKNIENVYDEVIRFCEPFIIEILLQNNNNIENIEQFKNNSLVFIFKLLGRPLVYLNLENSNPKSDSRIIAEKLLMYIAKFKVDFMSFLNFVNPFKIKAVSKHKDEFHENEFCNISLGVFYYLVIKENKHLDMVSYVYDPQFILEMIAFIVIDMLNIEHSRVRFKALVLCEVVLDKISHQSLNFFRKNGIPYGKLMEELAKIMVYFYVKEIRQLALSVFRTLILKYDPPSCYHVLLNIPNAVPLPGFVGFIVTVAKDFIFKAFNETNSVGVEYFKSKKCVIMLKRFCYLPDQEKTDIIELSDQIISTLNLIRFLLIRDKDNATGILEYIPQLEKDYLEPLQQGLLISVAHYKLQKKKLEKKGENQQLSVKVGGAELPNLPKEQNRHVLDVALNTFDLIESLLVRVKECIDDFRS